MPNFRLADSDEAPESQAPESKAPKSSSDQDAAQAAAEIGSDKHFSASKNAANAPASAQSSADDDFISGLGLDAPPKESPRATPKTVQTPPARSVPATGRPLGGQRKPTPQPQATTKAPGEVPLSMEDRRTDPSAASVAASGPSDEFAGTIQTFLFKIRKGLDALESPLSWLMRIAVPVGVLCLAYILAVVFGGGARVEGNERAAEVLRNVSYAALALKWCLIAIGVGMVLIAYEHNKVGAGVAATGFVLWFGLPLGLNALLGAGPVGAALSRELQFAGLVLMIAGGVKAVLDLMVFLWDLPTRMKARQATVGADRPVEAKQRLIAKSANMFSPCWNLPFCREAIRVKCPAFLARKRCWKFGRGCYCDEEMVARIVRDDPIEVIKRPDTRQSREKTPCARCHIYLEHQTHKFRMLSPLVFPTAVGIVYFAWPFYEMAFGVLDKAFQSVWSTIAFSPKNLTPDALAATGEGVEKTAQLGTSPEAVATVALYIGGFLLGFFLLVYLSKFVEWAIYKAKW